MRHPAALLLAPLPALQRCRPCKVGRPILSAGEPQSCRHPHHDARYAATKKPNWASKVKKALFLSQRATVSGEIFGHKFRLLARFLNPLALHVELKQRAALRRITSQRLACSLCGGGQQTGCGVADMRPCMTCQCFRRCSLAKAFRAVDHYLSQIQDHRDTLLAWELLACT